MADEITLDALMAKQQQMNDLAATLVGETKTDRIQAVAEELRKHGEELQEMAHRLAAHHAQTAVPRGYTTVVLTKEQRERIKAATGVDLEILRIADEAGISMKTMPLTHPKIIEVQAMREAERIKAGREAEAILQAQMQEAFAAIEAQQNPELNEQLERMKADSASFGGISKK